MKELRKFVYIPNYKGGVVHNKCIYLIPIKDKDDNKYRMVIGVEFLTLSTLNPNYEGKIISVHKILGNNQGKMFLTIQGIVNGHITGPIAQSLMLDIFVEMIVKHKPEWLTTEFPHWDYESDFKLRNKPTTVQNANIINFISIKNQNKGDKE